MTKLNDYLQDGANFQARAVLMILQAFSIEDSWSAEHNEYLAVPKVSRWENCREQGYVICLTSINFKRQLNIAFFEHRNSDSIHAVMWEQSTINSPSIDTADFGGIYKDKYDTSYSVGYCEIKNMADWIEKQLSDFWEATSLIDKEKANL